MRRGPTARRPPRLTGCSLACRSRGTGRCADGEPEPVNGLLHEAVVPERVGAGYQDVAEFVQRGGAAELIEPVGVRVDPDRRRQIAPRVTEPHLVRQPAVRM